MSHLLVLAQMLPSSHVNNYYHHTDEGHPNTSSRGSPTRNSPCVIQSNISKWFNNTFSSDAQLQPVFHNFDRTAIRVTHYFEEYRAGYSRGKASRRNLILWSAFMEGRTACYVY